MNHKKSALLIQRFRNSKKYAFVNTCACPLSKSGCCCNDDLGFCMCGDKKKIKKICVCSNKPAIKETDIQDFAPAIQQFAGVDMLHKILSDIKSRCR